MERWPVKPKHVAIAIGLLILAALIMNFNQRLEELNRLTTQAETARARATALMETQVALQTKVAFATSDEVVGQWAREERRWVRSGETPVVVLPADSGTPTASPTPPPQTPPPRNWQVWWELFFGD